MRTLAAALLLGAATIAWFTLALVPALHEYLRGTDTEPLQLRRGGGDVRHFALSFQRFVDAALSSAEGMADRAPAEGWAVALRYGEMAWHIPAGEARVRLPVDQMPAETLATHVVLSESALTVPDGSALFKELYVARGLTGGAECFYRAVLARGSVVLGARSGVLRWIDARGDLEAGEGTVLYGRASASESMHLHDGVRFQRVAAPVIGFGTRRAARVRARPSPVRGTPDRLQPTPRVTESFGRWLIEGDFEVPEGAHVVTDLVVTGALRIGAGARIVGAVKSATLVGGPGAVYDGAIVATTRLDLGEGSEVAGPVVVEGEAVIGANSQVGTRREPTTISAVRVRMGRGSVVCGEVWVRSWGEVESAGEARNSDIT